MLALVLWLLAGPRIELPGTPIRVEDLVFVGLAVLCLVLRRRERTRMSPMTAGVAAVVLTGLVSAVVASVAGTVAPLTSALFALRPAEYWIVLPAVSLLLAGRSVRWRGLLEAALAITTVLQAAFAVLQYVFQVGLGFSHAAYTRAAGLTVGPYELGAISAAFLVYWLSRRSFLLAGVAALSLVLSVSRVSLLAAAFGVVLLGVGSLVPLLRRRGLRGPVQEAGRRLSRTTLPLWRAAAWAALVAVAVMAAGLDLGPSTADAADATAPGAPTAPVTPTGPKDDSATPETVPDVASPPSNEVASRIASTSVLGSWTAGQKAAAAVPPLLTSDQYTLAAYGGINSWLDIAGAGAAGAEPSNLVRFFRWNLILDNIDTPREWALGLGPSFVGPSVDGSYLRFLADGGVVGAAAWLLLIALWLRRSPLWMISVSATFLIGAAFIDIVYAQRPMVLLWLLLAVAAGRRRDGAARPLAAEDSDHGDRAGRGARLEA